GSGSRSLSVEDRPNGVAAFPIRATPPGSITRTTAGMTSDLEKTGGRVSSIRWNEMAARSPPARAVKRFKEFIVLDSPHGSAAGAFPRLSFGHERVESPRPRGRLPAVRASCADGGFA